MESKIMLVFYGNDCLPYKDKERQVHYPIMGSAFLGASDTTKIRFYFDRIGNSNTTWVAVAKLPNGKQGSKVLSVSEDSELGENYAELSLDNWFTQAKGDVYIALQGYQGGVQYSYDSESGLYEITGTPTIQTTGSIKLAINYAPIGDSPDYTDEFTTYQQILAGLGDKLDITSGIIVVNDISQQQASNYENGQMFYNLADKKLYQLSGETFVVFQNYVVLNAIAGTLSVETYNLLLEHPEYPIVYDDYVYRLEENGSTNLTYVRHYNQEASGIINLLQEMVIVNKTNRTYYVNSNSYNPYTKSKTDELLSDKADKSTTYTKTETDDLLNGKQNQLVSGQNIKTINNESILGYGNIEIQGGGGGAWGEITGDIQDQSDLQAEFQNVREVAEGKNKSFILSYNATIPTNDTQAQRLKKPNGTAFTNLADFQSYVSGLTIINPDFNSQDNYLLFSANYKYFILSSNVVYKARDLQEQMKVGDIILITELDVPDRWVHTSSSYGDLLFYSLETTKIELTNYATKLELGSAIDGVNNNIAPTYDDTNTYTVGEVVIYNSKLYRCTTAISTAEAWDSSHWELVSVASDFVNLTGTQVISGSKTVKSLDFVYDTSNPADRTKLTIYNDNGYNSKILFGNCGFIFTTSAVGSALNGQTDLGASSYKWKDLYLAGTAYINGGLQLDGSSDTNSPILTFKNQYATGEIRMSAYNFTISHNLIPKNGTTPSLGTALFPFQNLYLSGQVYAQNTFNVINASDIESNTLTQAQYDLITNGKPTLISGTLSGYTDLFVLAKVIRGGNPYFKFFAGVGTTNLAQGLFRVNSSTLVITFVNDLYDSLANVGYINNKAIPAYPANANWKGEWYGTQAEYDALGTYDSNTTYYILES